MSAQSTGASRAAAFWRSVVLVLSGTATAQLIPLLGAMVLARIYAPAEYGIFATWLSAVTFATVVVTGRFEMALALEPDGPPRRIAVLGTLLAIAIGMCLSCLAVAALWLFVPALRPHWILMLSLLPAILLSALMQTWQLWVAAEGHFRDLTAMRILQSLAIVVLQILAGIAGPSALTLAAAHVAGLFFGVLFACVRMPFSLSATGGVGARKPAVLDFWRRHRRLPSLSLPSDSINTAATQLPLFIITARFGADIAGLVAITMRALGAPISMLGASVLDVFRRHAGQSWREQGNCRADYIQTFKILALGAVVAAATIAAFSEPLFALAFGERWRAAGTVAMWLIPMFALRFVASPLSYVIYVAGKQQVDLVWQVTLFAMTVLTLTHFSNYKDALIAYSAGYSALYVVYLALTFRFSRGVVT